MINVQRQIKATVLRADTAIEEATPAYHAAVSLTATRPTGTVELLIAVFTNIKHMHDACRIYAKLADITVSNKLSAGVSKHLLGATMVASNTVVDQCQELSAIAKSICRQIN